MKKITALCLGLCLLLSALTGCSKQEEEPSSQIESTPAPVTEQEPFEIGLVQYVQHAAPGHRPGELYEPPGGVGLRRHQGGDHLRGRPGGTRRSSSRSARALWKRRWT